MSKSYLDPKRSLGIAPAADRNVERVGPCCLDVNGKSAYLMKGRGGGAWWMIWMAMMCLVLGVSTPLFGSNTPAAYAAGLSAAAVAVVGFGLSLLWPLHVWRTHLPLRFNRQTRKVYFHHRGQTYVCDWDGIRAYLKVKGGITAQGAPMLHPHVNIEFADPKRPGETVTVFLMGTFRIGLTAHEEAAALWEYIRTYMEEGMHALPEPDLQIWRPLPFNELYAHNSPFPVLKSSAKWVWPFELLLFFPTRLAWFLLAYPTDLLYYHLAKRIRVNPFPPELQAACECEGSEAANREPYPERQDQDEQIVFGTRP